MKRSALIALCISIAAAAAFPQSRTSRTRKAPVDRGAAGAGTQKSPPKARRGGTQEFDPLKGPPPPPPSKDPLEDEVITSETSLVTTPVSVLDRNGRFMPGLKKKDFKIFENGVPQKITYFQSEEQPFTVILMIDISPSTRYSIDDIRFAAVTFVNQLRPNDKVMVVHFDRQVRVMTEPTSDKKALFTAIYKAQFGSGTSLYEAVDAAVNFDFVQVPGRKAVVIFTDGVDTTSRQADYDSTVTAVEEVDALVYPIRYDTQNGGAQTAQLAALQGMNLPAGVAAQLGRGSSEGEYALGKTYLSVLAENSGGRMFEANEITNLETAFAGVAEELRRQYAVGYYPDDTGKPGDRKKIKIEVVARPKAIVRSKTSYIVKGHDEQASAGDPAN